MKEEIIIELIKENTIFNEHDRTIHINAFRIAETLTSMMNKEISVIVKEQVDEYIKNNKYHLSFGSGRVHYIEK
ncbi:MAG: hypothetical protein J6T10_15350 [Methanobrevibacter sp.]|nr:hypothetical protein [Methanobrevibacter sp.]